MSDEIIDFELDITDISDAESMFRLSKLYQRLLWGIAGLSTIAAGLSVFLLFSVFT